MGLGTVNVPGVSGPELKKLEDAIQKQLSDKAANTAMTGATTSAAGKAGLVPAPAAGAATRYLRSDGTWAVPPDTKTTLSSLGVTATAAELNYVDGATGNIQEQLNAKAKGSGITATIPATVGWYRIATSAKGISRCMGLFEIEAGVTGAHSTTIISAATNYGVAASSTIHVLHHSAFSSTAIAQARIVYNTTHSGNYAYLEVYSHEARALSITVCSVISSGWTLVAPSTPGEVPDGYSSKTVELKNGTIKAGTFEGNLSGAATTITDTLPIAKGGTGATTAAAALAALGGLSLTSAGTQIPANSDLNTYITPGNYYVLNATNAKTIANSPTTGSGYRLIVIEGYNAQYTMQVASGSSNTVYVRVSKATDGSSWTDWVKATNTTLSDLGVTATATELNYVDGVTAPIQTQLDQRFSSQTSRTANTVLAAPNGSDGGATFRKLVAADIPSLAASKITSGTFAAARLPAATTSAQGAMTAAMVTKLNGIATGANAYTHPTTSGNKHIPSGGSSGQILRWSADGTAVWGADNNTTYSDFVKSGSGAKAGLVPAPSTTAGTTKYLREDGTWAVPPTVDTSLFATKANPVFTGSISMGRAPDTTVGSSSIAISSNSSATASGLNSVAIGANVTASDNFSIAFGNSATTSGGGRIAIGNGVTASGLSSVAIGGTVTSSGSFSAAFGGAITATGDYSMVWGRENNVAGTYSTSGGYNNTANEQSSVAIGQGLSVDNFSAAAFGKYNKVMTGGASLTSNTGDLFVLGNGTGTLSSARSNAFRVTFAGAVYGKAAYNATGADYAEFFEWFDGNPDNEDRIGYFVTMDGKQIRKAKPGEYILGIISGNPCVVGNSDEDWLGRWEMDEFGRFIKEPAPKTICKQVEEPVLDEDGNETGDVRVKMEYVEIEGEYDGWRYKANPDYDPTQEYIERKDRKEWDYVGMMGVLAVRDDGTCEVNGFCKVSEGGTATAAEKYVPGETYRVIERMTNNVVKVVFK